MSQHRFLAFDLGAESGRAVVGTLQDGQLALEEISRFPNEPVPVQNTLYWDVLALHNNILKGMRDYAARFGDAVDGVGIDTWGVDFGLLSKSGELLQNPVHHRDRRTAAMLDEVRARIAPEDLFRRTGMTLLPINTSLQLLSLRVNPNPVLDYASTLLMMPDLLAYFLTGRKCCERTNAITTRNSMTPGSAGGMRALFTNWVCRGRSYRTWWIPPPSWANCSIRCVRESG
jgi:sugar (pentulose or hexulose) kinase